MLELASLLVIGICLYVVFNNHTDNLSGAKSHVLYMAQKPTESEMKEFFKLWDQFHKNLEEFEKNKGKE